MRLVDPQPELRSRILESPGEILSRRITGDAARRYFKDAVGTSTFCSSAERMRIVYQFRELDENGVVLKYVFDLDRRTAVKLYWESTAFTVQMLAHRRVIAERSWKGVMES